MKALVLRITVPLLVFMAFASGAVEAADLSTFRVLIADPNTNIATVITNGSALDQNAAANAIDYGNIHFEGSLYTIFALHATSIVNSDGTGTLTLSGQIGCNGSTGCGSLTLMVEDDGFAVPGSGTGFTSTLGGYNVVTGLPSATGTLTAGSSISAQSWLGTANGEPAFGGSDGANLAYTSSMTAIPSDGYSELAAGSSTTGFSANSGVVTPKFSPGIYYSQYELVNLNFPSSSGSIKFSVTSTETATQAVPEPTSLLLLGSALLGFGVFRKKVI